MGYNMKMTKGEIIRTHMCFHVEVVLCATGYLATDFVCRFADFSYKQRQYNVEEGRVLSLIRWQHAVMRVHVIATQCKKLEASGFYIPGNKMMEKDLTWSISDIHTLSI